MTKRYKPLELKAFVKQNTRFDKMKDDLRKHGLEHAADLISHGWGNGYVCLPMLHPLFAMKCDEIQDKYNVYVHGGLTFSANSVDLDWPEIPKGYWWIVGFDTAHCDDSLERWPDAESVLLEANRLLEQLKKPTKKIHVPNDLLSSKNDN
jgi:hypothetical protein